jgi:hypothetical protein
VIRQPRWRHHVERLCDALTSNLSANEKSSSRPAAVGHTNLENTVRYHLGVEIDDDLAVSEQPHPSEGVLVGARSAAPWRKTEVEPRCIRPLKEELSPLRGCWRHNSEKMNRPWYTAPQNCGEAIKPSVHAQSGTR